VTRRGRDAGAVFAALADPTRRAVLAMVGQRGPLTATELAARLPVSRQAVTKHLDALHGAGLVERDKHGRDVRYELRSQPLDDAAAWMADVGTAWDRRLTALSQRASARRARPG
jgi:DNA-binding transcriptional ArsR family regulator